MTSAGRFPYHAGGVSPGARVGTTVRAEEGIAVASTLRTDARVGSAAGSTARPSRGLAMTEPQKKTRMDKNMVNSIGVVGSRVKSDFW